MNLSYRILLISSSILEYSRSFNTNSNVATSTHRRPAELHCATSTANSNSNNNNSPNPKRRNLILSAGMFGGIFPFGDDSTAATTSNNDKAPKKSSGPTNEVVKIVNGIKRKRLGGSDILVSELGLGTQRWASDDYNAPSKQDCYSFMDEAILKSGINLIDTAEQYPIPSGKRSREGDTEEVIGSWMKDRKVPRENVVIATKITGGRNVNSKNIKSDCEGSLKRLNTDYIDVYQLHWPQRYSPQSVRNLYLSD